MPFVDYYVGYLFRIMSYSSQCAGQPVQMGECGKFWGSLYLFAAFICFLVFVAAARYLIKERMEFNAYLKRKEERAKVAEPEVMEKYKWRG